MYDSIAPVCFDVLTFFFNALLIITHWLLLKPASASGAPFSPPELHPSFLPCLSFSFHPSPAPQPCLGIGLFAFGREQGGGWRRGGTKGRGTDGEGGRVEGGFAL